MRKIGVSSAVATAVALIVLSTTAAAGAAAKPTLTIVNAVGACGDQGPLVWGPTGDGDPLVYETFMIIEADGSLAPGLATSWKISSYRGSPNKVMTLTLRRGVRFSDGAPLDANAVKTWFDWRATDGSKAEGGGFDAALGPIRSVDVVGKYVARITLKSPNPDFDLALASGDLSYSDWGHIVSPRAIAQLKANPKSTLLSTHTFGAGPYAYLSAGSVVNDHCTYVPNRFYYDKTRQKWSKIVIRSVTDPNAVLAAMRAGQADVALYIDWRTAQPAAASGLKVVVNRHAGEDRFFFTDLGGKLYPALVDVRVRQALNYAINQKLIASTLCGPAAATTSMMDGNGIEGDDPRYVHYYSYNPAKAKALLAAAGYPNGFTFKVFTFGPAGSGRYDHESQALAVAKDLAAIGVTMQVDAPSTWDQVGQMFSGKAYAAYLGSTGVGTTWRNYTEFLQKDAPFGDQHGWHDPVIDRLWLRGQRLGKKAAAPIWREINARTVTRAYSLPVCAGAQYAFVSRKISGVRPTAGGDGFNPMSEWNSTGR
jgi:peptide/nickel transport system substrate-binding protein